MDGLRLHAHNLSGAHGPLCPPCSGLGRVLIPNLVPAEMGGRPTKSASICRPCKGTGVDLTELVERERRSALERINDLALTIARLEADIRSRYDKNGKASRQYWAEMIAWAVADGAAVANTTTETIVFPNVTIPANYMQDGRLLTLRGLGRFSTTATPTIRFRLRWGGVAGTLIWDSGTITTATVTAALWQIPAIIIQTRSNGSSGTLFAAGMCVIGSAAAPTVASATGAPAIGVFGSAGDDTPAAVTCDLTADTALSLTVAWSAASASNTETGHQYDLASEN